MFLQFYLTSLRGKEYFVKLNQKSGAGAGFFLPLGAGAGATRNKIPGAGAAWEKNQEPELLKKRQEPEQQKNLPAPQP